jgi:hypothetical protein
MISSYLVAAIAITMITGVAFGQSPSQTTNPAGSEVGSSIAETGILEPIAQGNRIEGLFGTAVEVEFPTRNDDVPKIVEFARPTPDTASR